MEAVLKDKRFAHVAKDPRFRRMPKGDRKVKIDKRFKDMFKDKKFKLKYTVDARGRPVNLSTNENLKKFYELTDSEDSEEEEETDAILKEKQDLIDKRVQSDSENSSEGETEESDVESDKFEGEESCSDNSEEVPSKRKKKASKNAQTTNSVKKKDRQKIPTKSEKKKGTGSDNNEKELVDIDGKRKKQISKKMELGKESKVLNKEIDFARGKGAIASSSSDDDSDEDSKVLNKEIDYARGKGAIDSSSSDDDSDDDSDKDSKDFDHKWNEQDENIVEVSDATRRVALCNMDWDRIKAKDIFFILSSFKTAQGLIRSVKIYPSEFGKKRMKLERLEGPQELKEIKEPDEEEEKMITKDGTKFQTEKLREYQLLRLRYYYAVVEFDSPETADHVYEECDGKEYESSSTKIDLRFIPDEMEFEDEPTSVCTDTPVDYKPNFFFNSALSQSKVDLTWDETDRDRTQKIARQFEPTPDDLEEDDLNAYMASSSDEEGVDYGGLVNQSDSDSEEEDEEENEDKQINKYKQLLQEIDQEEKKKKDLDVQMEITWEPGLKEATEEIVKKKKEVKSQTPWEDYLSRKKDKKKQRQLDKKHQRIQQQAASVPGDEEEEEGDDSDAQREDEAAFSDDDLPTGIDMDDPFFAEEMKTKGKSQKADKKKKKKKRESQEPEDVKEKEALSLLVMGEEDNKKHFNLKKLVDTDKKKKKKKKDKDGIVPAKKEDDFQVDVQDSRFSAMYESHLFNIDPSAPEFKKTKGTEAIVEEKLKRSKKKGIKHQQNSNIDNSSSKKRKIEEIVTPKEDCLASLVNSVKMKTKNFKSSKSKSKK